MHCVSPQKYHFTPSINTALHGAPSAPDKFSGAAGKDYTVHNTLNTFVSNKDYHIKKAFVVSNERTVTQNGKITYIPIYYIMFFNAESGGEKLTF